MLGRASRTVAAASANKPQSVSAYQSARRLQGSLHRSQASITVAQLFGLGRETVFLRGDHDDVQVE